MRHQRIAKIISADIIEHDDTGQVVASVTWLDQRGRRGTTSGEPRNPHMAALLARAARAGVTCPDDCGSCGADLTPSVTYPWHYPDANCRAIREPLTP